MLPDLPTEPLLPEVVVFTAKPESTKPIRQQGNVSKPLNYEVLKYLREYHYLTAQQLVNIHYSQGSLTRAQTILKRLFDPKLGLGHLDRRPLPHSGTGQPIYVYTLSTKGRNVLKADGYRFFTRFRPQEFHTMSSEHLKHELYANDVMIAARVLHRVAPDIVLEQWKHGLDIKREAKSFTFQRLLLDGERVDEKAQIVPDGWLDFRLKLANTTKQRRKSIVLELDRGTEDNPSEFKKKLRAYVHYAYENGPYSNQFGTNNITIAYATTAGENRMRTMREWCEEELLQQRLDQEANLFRFCALPRQVKTDPKTRLQEVILTHDPKALFLTAPIWHIPYTDTPSVLLWKP